MKKEIISGFSDASFCKDKNVAGLAIWVELSNDCVIKSSKFVFNVKTSIEAEQEALIYLMNEIRDNIDIKNKNISLTSDCIAALNVLDFSDLEENGATVNGKHVFSHTNKQDKDSIINRWCDSQAKKKMRIARRYTM